MDLPFEDRIEAGRQLATELLCYPIPGNAVVVAFSGGGAVVESYRGGRPGTDPRSQHVILVDEGMSTGSRMLEAARCIRSMGPAHLTITVPVTSKDAYRFLRYEANDPVCVIDPGYFYATGGWYRDFPRVSDKSIHHLLQARRQEPIVATLRWDVRTNSNVSQATQSAFVSG